MLKSSAELELKHLVKGILKWLLVQGMALRSPSLIHRSRKWSWIVEKASQEGQLWGDKAMGLRASPSDILKEVLVRKTDVDDLLKMFVWND